MHMKKHFLVLAALALPLLPASRAVAAVNPAVIPADARWVVYADLDTLRTSVIGKELITLAEKTQVETPGGKVGVDWQKLLATIGSATAYGTNLSRDPKDIDGTLVIQGTADLRKIAESILIQANLANPKDVTELTDLPFPAYGLKQSKAKPAAPADASKPADATKKEAAPKESAPMEVVIAFPPEPIVLVSKSKAQILKARDVFRGSAPSLAKGPASPLKASVQSSGDAYVFAASTVPAEKFFPEDGPQARILKMANSGSIALGERGENTFAHTELVASNDQMADKLMKILQGLTAMLSLAETSDKQLADFLSSAAVNRNGDAVTLDVAYSSARLAQMIKNLQQQSKPQDRAARTVPMINGQSLAEWQAEVVPAVEGAGPAPLASHTIANVALKNGTLLTLARQNNGGKNVRFDSVEIVPAEGAGAPLTFRPEFMRVAGPRGNWQQFQFPGADGNYTLKVAYVTDPEGKATFAVSARDPKPPTPAPAPAEKK
jgi:hypothetical protein